MPRRTLKVYTWSSFRRECQNTHHQTREICAAHSKAELARIVGVNDPRQLFNLDETGNEADIAMALSEPLTVFWRPLDGVRVPWTRG